MQAWTVTSAVAGNKRSELAQFWLAAPEDVLESLWNSMVGEATRQLTAQLTPSTYIPPEQVALREQLGGILQKGLQEPGATKALIANFLFSPPGQLRIQDAHANLPEWLLPGYQALYEQGGHYSIPPASAQANEAISQPHVAPQASPEAPNFGEIPNSLSAFTNNRIQLNRLLGLSNLYYIDPEDQEIQQELRQLRFSLSQLILQCPEHELEAHFSGDFSDRYWALVRSGIQKEDLQMSEQELRTQVTQRLQPAQGGGFGTPGAINAFLVAMIFFEPGSMQVDQPEQKLPGWLLQGYHDIFAQALQG